MNYELYVIVGGIKTGDLPPALVAEQVIAGGADIIQLRDKSGNSLDMLRAGKTLRAITRKTGTAFIVNDRLDVALACGADGVHLGQDDMRVSTARQLTPPGFILGVSVGTVEEAVQAERDGADYVAISPTFSTASKADAGSGLGLARLTEIRQAVSLPIIAIGGITRQNARDVILAGADGIAVISAIAGNPDITAAARDLRSIVLDAKGSAGHDR
jgi:thiamine-phosphate pyrophosphorylase